MGEPAVEETIGETRQKLIGRNPAYTDFAKLALRYMDTLPPEFEHYFAPGTPEPAGLIKQVPLGIELSEGRVDTINHRLHLDFYGGEGTKVFYDVTHIFRDPQGISQGEDVLLAYVELKLGEIFHAKSSYRTDIGSLPDITLAEADGRGAQLFLKELRMVCKAFGVKA